MDRRTELRGSQRGPGGDPRDYEQHGGAVAWGCVALLVWLAIGAGVFLWALNAEGW